MSDKARAAIQRIQQMQDENRRRKAAKAAARLMDKQTREGSSKKSKSTKVRTPRAPRAPKSASQYHFNQKYSNRAGKNRAPKSCTDKLKYDFGLDEKGDERVAFIYISAPDKIPAAALDLLAVAREAERTAGRQANSRQMAHLTGSLPENLSNEARAEIVRTLCDHLRAQRDDVPIFAAMHAPDKDEKNWHFHISHPLRHIHPTEDGGFIMGERIMFEQRAAVRKAAGLEPTNHSELRDWREHVANVITDAVAKETGDLQTAERWRWGHLTLERQVEKAAERGDVEFVADSVLRDATIKEGLNNSPWRKTPPRDFTRSDAQSHNAQATSKEKTVPAPKLLTQAAVNAILERAKAQGITTDPEQLRLFARDCGVTITWAKSESSSKAQGVSYALAGGPKFAGKNVGMSLKRLQDLMGWDEPPAYSRVHKKADVQKYEEAKAAGRIKPDDALTAGATAAMARANNLVKQAKEVAARQATKHQTPAKTQPPPPKLQGELRASAATVKEKEVKPADLLKELQDITDEQNQPRQQAAALTQKNNFPHPPTPRPAGGKRRLLDIGLTAKLKPAPAPTVPSWVEEEKERMKKEQAQRLDEKYSKLKKLYQTAPKQSFEHNKAREDLTNLLYDHPHLKTRYFEQLKKEAQERARPAPEPTPVEHPRPSDGRHQKLKNQSRRQRQRMG
ncbi:hypothetical protein [Pusillimonas sp. NJUB218]|uniref:hypothetical protein n=1 Tax=Pusillimonas sp. NJUB218 TaxID=2023230 RepID=UPI000F4CA511|nr:hypothetical protein [Pusillimonas sp. NJUB218]ROT44305.1 hypothetical protein CHR62_13380 [Pusillimonas sp. NJUB218]